MAGTEVIAYDITEANAKFNAPPVTTGFKENGVGIDPAGCGCTDCIIGDSIPFNETNAKKLALLAFQVQNHDRKFYSRLGDDCMVMPVEDGWEYGFACIQLRDGY